MSVRLSFASLSAASRSLRSFLPVRTFASLSRPALKSSSALDMDTATTSTVKLQHPKLVNSEQHKPNLSSGPAVPEYLQKVYWWAYLHPNAVRIFERQWLVDAILWGNFRRLRDAALEELATTSGCQDGSTDDSRERMSPLTIQGRTLQVACVYGNFTQLLARRLAPDASLDVVDVAPIQIENLTRKMQEIQSPSNVHISRQNAAHLGFDNDAFSQVILFFLLHEVPGDVRQRSLTESLRVLRPGGKLVIVDYHQPNSWLHPHRYLMPLVLHTLEPFAMDLWRHEIQEYIPEDVLATVKVRKELFFGGLYQKVVITKL